MKDILLDDDLDLQIADGDLVIGDSDAQHQKILILSDKSEFKENPMRGVGTRRYLEASNPDDFLREIRQEFIADGMQVKTIQTGNNGQITVDANY